MWLLFIIKAHTEENVRGKITKNNKWGGIIKDDNFKITCADRENWMAGIICWGTYLSALSNLYSQPTKSQNKQSSSPFSKPCLTINQTRMGTRVNCWQLKKNIYNKSAPSIDQLSFRKFPKTPMNYSARMSSFNIKSWVVVMKRKWQCSILANWQLKLKWCI